MISLDYDDAPREARLYAEKAARSISEIQQTVSSVADVMIFLEILGYNDAEASDHGFANLSDFANYVFGLVDFYKRADSKYEPDLLPVKSAGRRLLEGLALAFPVVGMLAVLLVSGVSLWMTRVLSEQITTAFMAGVFLGILVTEGSMQAFNRLFSFYYIQANIGETKRVLSRNDDMVFVTLVTTSIMLFLVGTISGIPSSPMWMFRVPAYTACVLGHFPFVASCHLGISLIWVTILSTITVAIHRSSYMVLFALKKVGVVALAYSVALIALVGVYTLTTPFIPSIFARYVFSLIIAFGILSVPAIYYNRKIMTHTGGTLNPGVGVPHFFAPFSVGDHTVSSRFGIQLWETIPYFVFGTFYFLMLFADRILSWIFNPLVTEYGFALPIAFNSVYHVGADPALAVLLGTTIVAYVVMSPIYEQISNLSAKIRVMDTKAVQAFLQKTYNQLFLVSATVAFLIAFALNYEALPLMHFLGGGVISLEILRTASIADVFYSIFLVNSMFLSLMNKIKVVATIAVACASIVIVVGTLFAIVGFQYIIWATFLSALVSMVSSTLYCLSLRGKYASLVLGKYV